MTARDLFDAAANDEGKGNGLAPSTPSASRARAFAEVGVCGECGNGKANSFDFIVCALQVKWTSFAPSTVCPIGSWCPKPAVQAKREAQAGIDQAVDAADREVQGWSDLALRFVRLYATQHRGKQFIGHDIVQASIAAGVIQPPNAKAWGGPIQRAARAGHLVRVGFAEDPNRHGNPVPLWEAA